MGRRILTPNRLISNQPKALPMSTSTQPNPFSFSAPFISKTDNKPTVDTSAKSFAIISQQATNSEPNRTPKGLHEQTVAAKELHPTPQTPSQTPQVFSVQEIAELPKPTIPPSSTTQKFSKNQDKTSPNKSSKNSKFRKFKTKKKPKKRRRNTLNAFRQIQNHVYRSRRKNRPFVQKVPKTTNFQRTYYSYG